jgi:hypothetical protein
VRRRRRRRRRGRRRGGRSKVERGRSRRFAHQQGERVTTEGYNTDALKFVRRSSGRTG